MTRIAMVTGATSGVGREFCRQLDGAYYGRIDEFWAVGRDESRLEELSRSLYAPVRPFALDLRQERSFDVLRSELASMGDASVSWLVNSAGFGWFGDETSADPSLLADMVRVNCLATVEMTGLALPYVQAGSRIVNMSSVAAYLPVPGMGVYAATKSFVLDVTRTLNQELAGTGINACAVCPKAMATGFWKDVGSEAVIHGAMSLGTEQVYDVVRKAIAAVEAGRGAIVTAPDMRLLTAVAKVLPYGVLRAAAGLVMPVHAAQDTEAEYE